MVNEGGKTMDLTNDERAALAVLDDMTLAAREAYNAALLACNAAESEYEYASMAAALVMVRRALAAEAEVTRLRAENATLRASTDAAVDGVRAMLPAALKVAREEGAEEMRSRCVVRCEELAEQESAIARAAEARGDQLSAAIRRDQAIARLQVAYALRALRLGGRVEAKP